MSLLSPPLRAFTAIVRSGTVHAAARELQLTQTGVTQRIRSLEKELGTTLFLRRRTGMKLTQEGEALLRYCKGAAELEGEALSRIRGAAKDRPIHLTIAGPTSVMSSRIVDQCAPLYSEWPMLHLNFVMNDADDRIGMLRSGEAELAVVSPEQVPNEMDSKKLRPDRYILVATARWKGRRLADLLETEPVIDFHAGDLTTTQYLKKFDLISGLKRARLYVNNNEAIAKLFCRGIGFGTLTQEVAKPYLDAGELVAINGGAVMEEPLALAWYPRTEKPPYFEALIKSIR